VLSLIVGTNNIRIKIDVVSLLPSPFSLLPSPFSFSQLIRACKEKMASLSELEALKERVFALEELLRVKSEGTVLAGAQRDVLTGDDLTAVTRLTRDDAGQPPRYSPGAKVKEEGVSGSASLGAALAADCMTAFRGRRYSSIPDIGQRRAFGLALLDDANVKAFVRQHERDLTWMRRATRNHDAVMDILSLVASYGRVPRLLFVDTAFSHYWAHLYFGCGATHSGLFSGEPRESFRCYYEDRRAIAEVVKQTSMGCLIL